MKRLLTLMIAACALGPLQEQRPTFVSHTELVRLNLLIRDRGKPVLGLTARDFAITDSGVPQQVDRVLSSDASLQAWLVVDQSGSVRDLGSRLRQAAELFAAELSERDRVGLITFRHGVRILQPLSPPRALAGFPSATAAGFTSLRDALVVALALRDSSLDQALILVLSDGSDTMSWITELQLDRAVGRSDAVIYSVTETDSDGVKLLRRLAEQTAGDLVPLNGQTVSRAFRSILDEMKSRYIVTYYPSGLSSTGWREVQVRLRHRDARIKARHRYYVPSSGGGGR
jgi:VWFA-related protein